MVDSEMVFARPAAALRPLVDCYVGYRQSGVTLGIHRGLPSRWITVVISLAEPSKLVGGVGAQHGPRSFPRGGRGPACWAGADRAGPVQRDIHARLSPLGAQRLLGISAIELSGTVCDFEELPVRGSRTLVDRLHEATDWPARLATLDEQLGQCLADAPVTLAGEIQWARQQLVRSGRTARIAGLAEQVGWSRRHFSQRFAHAVGVSPKQAARLVRFERSTALLRCGAVGSVAGLAAECGYYDQAHLAHDWGQLAGCSPTTWIADELPLLQDTGPEPGAHSPA